MSDKSIFISSEILREIEESFNFPKFDGIKVGATLNDALSVVF